MKLALKRPVQILMSRGLNFYYTRGGFVVAPRLCYMHIWHKLYI